MNKGMEFTLGEILLNKNLTISTAESCTGGLLSGKIIDYPGISSSFLEGAVTYSNSSKIKRLNVKKATLENFGAVSRETAAEMAEGIAATAGADIGISTTGIAGPEGGSVEKPVGLVYIGLYIKGKVKTKEFRLSGNREEVRNKTVEEAIKWAVEELKNNF